MMKLDHPVCRNLLLVVAGSLAGGMGSLAQSVAKTVEPPFTNSKRNLSGSGLAKFLSKGYFNRIQPLVQRQPVEPKNVLSCALLG